MSELIARRSDSRRPLAEIAAVVVFVLAAEWMVPPLFGRNLFAEAVPVALVFTIIISSHLRTKESPRDMGWRIDNFAAAAVVLAPPNRCSGWVPLCLKLDYGKSSLGRNRRANLPACLDAFGIDRVGSRSGISAAKFHKSASAGRDGRGVTERNGDGLDFAVLHLPNPWLTAGTFLGGLLISHAYQRVPNLLAAGLAHAILTVILVLTVPYPMLHGLMRRVLLLSLKAVLDRELRHDRPSLMVGLLTPAS